ncbi:MAG: beta-galactosidase trimerization domain-containing protein, partial [Lachnospiraceae bacterium]|nr:beta-galactosidase trimerization domain-containing protein [Lachnospiraceae bacterium]
LMRSLKKSSFLLMESTPSVVNWRQVNRLKRPGMHELSSLQAVACGSDSVQYFQWRKGRGSSEKYHGAVVDHRNGDDTRVFREVTKLGERLEKIASKVIGTCNRPRIAMVFDWENWWAMEDAKAVDNNLNYQTVFLDFFRPLWELGVDVDMVDMEGELELYSVVVAPLNYMYKKGYVEKVRAFVKQGGCYITTCWSGEVDDSDLTYTGAHPLEDVLGIRTEEIDVPDGYCENSVRYQGADYRITGLCGLVHAKGAEVLAEYQQDFYRGYPALTRNTYGSGEAYYIASLNEQSFLKDFYSEILNGKGLGCGLQVRLTQGVTVNERSKPVGENGETEKVWFLQNFNREAEVVELLERYENVETGETLSGKIELQSFECVVLTGNKREDYFEK